MTIENTQRERAGYLLDYALTFSPANEWSDQYENLVNEYDEAGDNPERLSWIEDETMGLIATMRDFESRKTTWTRR